VLRRRLEADAARSHPGPKECGIAHPYNAPEERRGYGVLPYPDWETARLGAQGVPGRTIRVYATKQGGGGNGHSGLPFRRRADGPDCERERPGRDRSRRWRSSEPSGLPGPRGGEELSLAGSRHRVAFLACPSSPAVPGCVQSRWRFVSTSSYRFPDSGLPSYPAR
jgi:hypothetical protein